MTKQLTQDIRSSRDNFTVKHALVITYIYEQRRFQVVLVTDGAESLAVLNYEKLDGYRSDSGVILNEPGCTSNKKLMDVLNTNLLNGTNAGRRGRFVFNLTKIDCFKPVTGIKLMENNLRMYGNPFISVSVSGKVFELNEYGEIALHVAEYLTDSPISKARTNAILQGYKRVGHYYFVSSIFDAGNFYRNIVIKNLFVLGETQTSSSFNYGSVNFTLGYDVECRSISFETTMETTPGIKLTVQLLDSNMKNHVFVWMVNVSTHGFDICAKEIITFSGERNFKVNFVAVSDKYMDITEVEHVTMAQSPGQFQCLKKEFMDIYLETPTVFSSIEMMVGSDSEPVSSWIQSITLTHVQVCFQSNAETDFKFHLLIAGKISPCMETSCPDHLQCYTRNINNSYIPYCGCISNCTDRNQNEFCGTNFKTYKSMCELNQEHCFRYGNNSKTNITIKHHGKCLGEILLFCIVFNIHSAFIINQYPIVLNL